METGRIIAWGIVASVLGVILFVQAPQKSGTGRSGGEQASDIINATFSGINRTISTAQGNTLG